MTAHWTQKTFFEHGRPNIGSFLDYIWSIFLPFSLQFRTIYLNFWAASIKMM